MAGRSTSFEPLARRLTDQELRVAVAVGRGATNKAVARELQVTSKTVEFHLANIYRKLGIDGRSALANLVGAGSVSPPTGTVTFLVTDLDEAAELWRHAPRQMRAATMSFQGEVLGIVSAHRGFVVDRRRDGLVVAFSTPDEASDAALVCLCGWQPPVGAPVVRARVGLHTAVARLNSGVYPGSAITRAEMTADAARGGQLLASNAAAALLADQGWAMRRLDELAGPDGALFQLIHEDLDDVRLPPRSSAPRVGNVGTEQVPLVGRADDLAELMGSLGSNRLVSLVGPGGVGKTVLALAAGRIAAGAHVDGTWLVELGRVIHPIDVLAAVSDALGLKLHGTATYEAVGAALREQSRLVVLDNCEHVLDATRRVVSAIVAHSAGTVVLATSREPLGLDGERVVQVAPLALERNGSHSLAAELFITRSADVLGGFEPDAAEVEVIEDICRQLDGLPLALELAAARLGPLGVHELATALADRFRALGASRRGFTGRHHSLRATISWSYDALSRREQATFDRLSVFVGGFDAEAASTVVDGDAPADDVAPIEERLDALVDKSLLQLDGESVPRRYTQLETIRMYGSDRLRARRSEPSARRRHVAHYIDLVERVDEGIRFGDELRWHRTLVADWPNVRAALASAIEFEDADAACRCVRALFWWGLSRARVELGDWALLVREMPTATEHPLRPIVTSCAAYFVLMRGDLAHASTLQAEAEEEERRLGLAIEPWVPVVQSFFNDLGDPYEAPLEVQRRGEPSLFWRVLGMQQECAVRSVVVAEYEPSPERTAEHLARIRYGREVADQLGNQNGVAYSAMTLGSALARLDPPAAAALLEEAIEIATPLDLEITVAQSRSALAVVYADLGRHRDVLRIVCPAIEQHLVSGATMELWVATASAIRSLAELGHAVPAARALGALLPRRVGGLAQATPIERAYPALIAVLGEDELERLKREGEELSVRDAAGIVLRAAAST